MWRLCALIVRYSSPLTSSMFGSEKIFTLIWKILLTLVTGHAPDWTRSLVSHGSWWQHSCRCASVELVPPSSSRRSCGWLPGPILDPHCVYLKSAFHRCCHYYCCWRCCCCGNRLRPLRMEPIAQSKTVMSLNQNYLNKTILETETLPCRSRLWPSLAPPPLLESLFCRNVVEVELSSCSCSWDRPCWPS